MSDMISLELQFFLASLVWGVLLLLAYDGLRIIRKIVSHSAFFIAVEDVVFWSISGVLIFIMMYERNNGTIRGFSIAAIVIGMILYHYLVSEYIVKLISSFLHIILSFIGNILKVIFKPVRIGMGFSNKFTKKLKKTIAKQLKKIVRTVKITLTRK